MSQNKGGKLTVFSGGQRLCGADQGGLAAARDRGLKTGGWAPKGWRTQNGTEPRLKLLGLKEHKSWNYAPRTFSNVKDTDGTIRLAYNFNSPGESLTLKAINQYKKPYYDVDLSDPDFIFEVVKWIDDNKIERLNVAGNAGATAEEGNKIFQEVRNYLSKVFRAFEVKDENT